MEKKNDLKVGIESGIFDNFALSCFRNCPEYYHKRIGQGVVKPGAKKTAADFGTGIHMALENYYKQGMTDSAVQESFDLFTKYFRDHEDMADDKRTLGKGLEILVKYFDKYRREPFNVVATEVGGALELSNDILYSFRIDLVVEWQTPKGIYGMDHKTTSSMNRMIGKPNNQMTGYEWALRQYYQDVIGWMVNCIGVYKSDKTRDKNTGKMVERDIFLRIPTSRTRKEIDQWVSETLQLVKMIEYCTTTKTFPKHSPEFCTSYATKCQYIDLCSAQDSEQILSALLDTGTYEIDWWRPYEEVGEEVDEI